MCIRLNSDRSSAGFLCCSSRSPSGVCARFHTAVCHRAVRSGKHGVLRLPSAFSHSSDLHKEQLVIATLWSQLRSVLWCFSLQSASLAFPLTVFPCRKVNCLEPTLHRSTPLFIPPLIPGAAVTPRSPPHQHFLVCLTIKTVQLFSASLFVFFFTVKIVTLYCVYFNMAGTVATLLYSEKAFFQISSLNCTVCAYYPAISDMYSTDAHFFD